MGQIVLYIAMSLDGFIADSDGQVGWLDQFNTAEEDYGYNDFFGTLDGVILGSKTYEQVLSFPVEYPYKTVETIVFTKRTLPLPKEEGSRIRFCSEPPKKLVADIQTQYDKDIWLVGGAELIATFWQNQLIDKLILFVMPILLGEGILLFKPMKGTQNAILLEHSEYPNGVIKLMYQFKRI